MFIDYYSILGVSYPSNAEEMRTAYLAKRKSLGIGSANRNNPNYQTRINLEVAYRVLNSSYSLKTAYDEEYQKAVVHGLDVYEITDDWILSAIEREKDFVVNRMLNNGLYGFQNDFKKKEGCGMKMLRCAGYVFLAFAFLLGITMVRTCTKKRVEKSFEYYSESADYKLKRVATEINSTLPQYINKNITIQTVQIESNALVYVYKVDDKFFSEYKDYVTLKNFQLDNLRTVYNEMKPMIDLLIETHRGLHYRYICKKSNEVTEIKIYYSDLLNLK